jgi:hypothetical protein
VWPYDVMHLEEIILLTCFEDPQGFWDLLGTSPWHADTVLQVSEVYRHREGNPSNFVIPCII